MGQMRALRAALLERVGQLPDLTTYPFVPDGVNAPAVWVEPNRPFVDYQQVFAGGVTEWQFVLTIVVNRIDEESAQDELDDYLDPFGPFVELLQDRSIRDALYDGAHYVEVMSATRYGTYQIGGTAYLGAQIMITVRA